MSLVDAFKNLRTLIEGGVNISFLNKATNNIHIDQSTKTIELDLSKLTSKQIQEISEHFIPAIKEVLSQSDDFLIEEPKSEKQIQQIDSFANSKKNKKYIAFVTEQLPPQDVTLWISALMLRDKFEEGNSEKVRKIKKQMIQYAGPRGRNIANICNGGYLESHIIPLHEHLVGDQTNKKLFEEIYELIVNDHIFAIFVSQRSTEENLKTEILSKIRKIKSYGWNKIHIHGIGKENVKMVKSVVLSLSEEVEEINDIIEVSDSSHIKVTLLL